MSTIKSNDNSSQRSFLNVKRSREDTNLNANANLHSPYDNHANPHNSMIAQLPRVSI